MKRHLIKKIIALFYLVILINFANATGSILTGQLTPSTINICGNNAQYVTLTAYNLFNLENTTLVNVNAVLFLHSPTNQNPGLSFITNQNINLGNLNPLSYSGINPSWTLQCNSPNSGIYTAYINYTTSNGFKGSSLNEQTATIIVHDATTFAGNISLESSAQSIQEDYPIINDNTPTIKVFTTKNSICKGSLNNDKDYENMDFLFYGLGRDHNYTFINQLNEGKHIVYVKCKDDINSLMQLALQFEIDSKEPLINVISPKEKVLGDYAEIIIYLNEIAECKYSKSNIEFNEMKSFELINGSSFKFKIEGLDEKTYLYYVKCKDKIGNIAQKQITFEVSLPPKAIIQLEKTTLSKGTYELKLIPSKKLKSAYLSYSFTDEPQTNREIGLVREGNYFKGYLIIDEYEKTKQGLFSFKGIDLQDNEGTEITEGTFFLVDTIKPIPPDSLQGKNTDSGILLRWYYDGERPEKFNIYRATIQGVSPIFYYDTIKPSEIENFYEYLDKNTESGQLYYYRVSAIDMAGNLGVMSNEISVYSTKDLKAEAKETINLPTQQTRDLKKSVEKNADSLLIDLEWALNNLKEQSTKEKSVEDLSLIKKVLDAKENIERQKNYLKSVNLNEISDTELRNKLSEIEALMARTKKLTPKSLEIEKTTMQIQSLTNNDIELIVREIIEEQNYSESQIKKYLKEIQKINSNLKVEAELKTLKINYLDNSQEKQVLVRKIFSYEKPEPINDIIIIEMIPKTVAGDVSSIDIKTPEYSIVKADPIISWKYSELSFDKKQYYYVLLSNDNSESAKTTKTIAIIDPIKLINANENNLFTGFSIFIANITSNTEYIGLIIGSFIIMVLLTYYLFSANNIDLKNYIGIEKIKKFNLPFIKKIARTGQNIAENPAQNKIKGNTINNSNEALVNEALLQKPENQNSIYLNGRAIHKTNSLDFDFFKKIFETEDITKNNPDNYFYAKNGEIIRGISELKQAIEKMDDFTFYYHVNESKNDFADWLFYLYKNKQIYDLIKSTKTKNELIELLENLKKN